MASSASKINQLKQVTIGPPVSGGGHFDFAVCGDDASARQAARNALSRSRVAVRVRVWEEGRHVADIGRAWARRRPMPYASPKAVS